MNDQELAKRIVEKTRKMKSSEISEYIDKTELIAPIPFRGTEEIKLIILGQDPTVRKMKHRENIKVTLLLDQKEGRLPNYLRGVCKKLDLDLDQSVYATNILKNFFIDRPDQLEKNHPGLIRNAFSFWKDLLLEELSEFENIPVITLGEPVLNCFLKDPDLIRYYWGYGGPAKYGKKLKHILPEKNELHRHIFPFPHIHGLGHKLYREGLNDYIKYMRDYLK
jgi:hypothetical protein